MIVKRYIDFTKNLILEKTIGSENIRLKYYSDIDKSIFYKIVNIDPTSIRKKDFSKPGKYTKWLLKEYRKERLNDDLVYSEDFKKRLNYYLFIFSTGWFKSNIRKYANADMVPYAYSGNKLDIFKYDLSKFMKSISNIVKDYEAQTEKSKYDTVYSDDKVDILVPLNFSASYETAKNTEWCSQSLGGYSYWSSISILFRIIPKDESYDKLKLTWLKKENIWYIACSKYPEIYGNGSPFDIEDGMELWKVSKDKQDNSTYSTNKQWLENSKKIEDTMNLLSPEAKKYMDEYHKNKGV